MTTRHLDRIFKPKGIAVVGASDRPGSVGQIIFNNLIGSGYNGVVFPVNAKRDSVQGVQAYHSIAELPDKVDLAVIATPAPTIPGILEDCGKKGIKGIIIISAGFAEMGEEGIKVMNQMEETRKRYDQRIIGPNCLGIILPKLKINASFGKNIVSPGKVAFISQSGALGTAALDWALARNIGFSNFVSLGSMLDVSFGDLMDYFGADNETGSIIMYIESIKDPRKFLSAARGFTMNKPILVIKAGRVAEGAKAAASHTGALAGADNIYDAVFNRVGIVRVDEVEDLFYCSETLSMQPTPEGNRLVIITNAGGPGVMGTDALIKEGGKLAKLSDETMQKLNEVLPAYWSRSNPVDILGDATAERYAKALDICLADPNIDGAIIMLTPQAMTNSKEIAQALIEKTKDQKKPILAAWMGAGLVHEARVLLRSGSIPCYETPEQAVKSFMYMYRYKKNIELLYETPEEIGKDIAPNVEDIKNRIKYIHDHGRSVISEWESKEILEAYGIQTTLAKIAKSPEESATMAKQIGFPVAMKINSEDITHKSNANCVMLDIHSEEEAKQKYDEIINNARNYKSDARLDGVSVQKMVNMKGHEIIIGSKKDPLFGTVIMFGMGGVAVEAIKDSNIAVPPLNQTLAKRLIEGTKVYKLLKDGYRNTSPANLMLLEEMLVKFSQLIVDLPELAEIDINPVIIDDKMILALDARMMIDADYYNKQDVHPHDHMMINPYPKEFVKKFDFNGKEMTFRPIRPEDEPMWIEMFNSFSEETRRYRFFHVIRDMPHEKRIRYLFNDYSREIAIVAEVTENDQRMLLGVARMTGDANHETAEFAIVVRDEWQSHGLGEEMFDHIMHIAKKKGWKRMIATTLGDNMKMVNLFKKKGCTVTKDPDENSYSIVYELK